MLTSSYYLLWLNINFLNYILRKSYQVKWMDKIALSKLCIVNFRSRDIIWRRRWWRWHGARSLERSSDQRRIAWSLEPGWIRSTTQGAKVPHDFHDLSATRTREGFRKHAVPGRVHQRRVGNEIGSFGGESTGTFDKLFNYCRRNV